jgi:hypothetical protein
MILAASSLLFGADRLFDQVGHTRHNADVRKIPAQSAAVAPREQ